MAYKIEYTPDYTRKELTSRLAPVISVVMMLAGLSLFAALLYYNRESVSCSIGALEQLAQQVQEGESVSDVITTFYQTLQGVIGG